jgi:hypothetical protein
MAAAMRPEQTSITECIDIECVANSINKVGSIRKSVNELFGKETDSNVKSILDRFHENAKQNSMNTSSKANLHTEVIKGFASSLFCLT